MTDTDLRHAIRRKGTRDAEATRRAILDAGRAEFAEHGLGGGRIDAIGARAGCNKAMIYHYFGSKAALFSAVLEHNYTLIRCAETKLDLTQLPPVDAVRRLVEFSFDYVAENPEFTKLINEENLHGGIHLDADAARELNSPIIGTLHEILKRGAGQGCFRADVDPRLLYISIASLCNFSITNQHTLSIVFDLPKDKELSKARRQHMVDVILGYLRPL